MKKIYILLLLLIPLFVHAQIDTAQYLIKPNPTTMRTDTLATNLLTYNQTTHLTNLMSGATLTAYFRQGLQTALTAGTGLSISSNVITNTAPDQTVTLTAGNGIAITGTYPNFTIAVVQPTIAFTSRTLNSNFTINTTKPALVFYTVSVSVQNPLLAGTSVGNAFLEYSLDAGSTWKSASSLGNSSNVGITVTVQLTNLQTGVIGGIIPANALTRIRTTTSGTATVTFIGSEEIVY